MSAPDTFDEWASDGRDREMAGRHWHTARHAIAMMPVEPGDVVIDLGTGSGYAARAMRSQYDTGLAYGVDASRKMIGNASASTDDPWVGFLGADFGELPFSTATIDHAFSMEALYYADDLDAALREARRVLRSGGTFYCAVNYYEENHYAHGWPDRLGVDMVRWSREDYRAGFREAGFHLAGQVQIPDRETEIPPAEAFPTENFQTRAEMIERYRELGTLLTVGVVP